MTEAELLGALSLANLHFLESFPGELPGRQPVHTVYGGAHLFKFDTCRKLGNIALASVKEHAGDAAKFADAIGLKCDSVMAAEIYKRVLDKLAAEPVEDFRIDFEDGYGYRFDAEEDGHASSAALAVARAMSEGTLPLFFGFRVKALSEESKERSARTLEIFLSTLLQETSGRLPDNFVVTLPKVLIPAQVECFVGLLKLIEDQFDLPHGTIKIEIMVESTASFVGARGEMQLPALVEAAEGRCRGAHFGAYDYTASCDVTAAEQRLNSSVCDFARHMMKVSLAGRGIWLSDGATNVMPVGTAEAVHSAWKLSYNDIRHSLGQGFYCGWDLHPAQLPVRYAAVYAFFLQSLPAASARLKSFMERAAQANLVGNVFDDAASGQGLLNYFLRAINCGAIDRSELESIGLTYEEIASKSFLDILAKR